MARTCGRCGRAGHDRRTCSAVIQEGRVRLPLPLSAAVIQEGRVRRQRRCAACGVLGHDRRTCSVPLVQRAVVPAIQRAAVPAISLSVAATAPVSLSDASPPPVRSPVQWILPDVAAPLAVTTARVRPGIPVPLPRPAPTRCDICDSGAEIRKITGRRERVLRHLACWVHFVDEVFACQDCDAWASRRRPTGSNMIPVSPLPASVARSYLAKFFADVHSVLFDEALTMWREEDFLVTIRQDPNSLCRENFIAHLDRLLESGEDILCPYGDCFALLPDEWTTQSLLDVVLNSPSGSVDWARPKRVLGDRMARLNLCVQDGELRVLVCTKHRYKKPILHNVGPPQRPASVGLTLSKCKTRQITTTRHVVEQPRRGQVNYTWHSVRMHQGIAGLSSVYLEPPQQSVSPTIIDDLIVQNMPSYSGLHSPEDVLDSGFLKVPLETEDFVVPPCFSTKKKLHELCRVPYLISKERRGLPFPATMNYMCKVPAAVFFIFDQTFAVEACRGEKPAERPTTPDKTEKCAITICRHFFGKSRATKGVLEAAVKVLAETFSSPQRLVDFSGARRLPHGGTLEAGAHFTELMERPGVLFILLDNGGYLYRYSTVCSWWYYDPTRVHVPPHHRHIPLLLSTMVLLSSAVCVASSGTVATSDFDLQEDVVLNELVGEVPRCHTHGCLLSRVDMLKPTATTCTICSQTKIKWTCAAHHCSFALCKICNTDENRQPECALEAMRLDARGGNLGDEISEGARASDEDTDDDIGLDRVATDNDDDRDQGALDDLAALLSEDDVGGSPVYLTDGSTDSEEEEHRAPAIVTSRVPLLLVASPHMELARQGRTTVGIKNLNALTSLVNSLRSPAPLAYVMGSVFPMHYYKEIRSIPCRTIPLSRVQDTAFLESVGLPSLSEMMYVLPRQQYSSCVYDISYLAFLHEIKLNVEMQNTDTRPARVHHFYGVDVVKKRCKDVLPMSESEVFTWMRRMEGFLRKNMRFNIFHTTTCNFNETPGMRGLSRLVREHGLHEGALLVARVMQWFRFQKLYVSWAFRSPFSPAYSPNAQYIARNEWQTTSSGNLPHMHCGSTNSKPQLANATSITSDIRAMFHFAELEERVELMGLARRVLPHNCRKAGSRCQRRYDDGTTRCRVPRYPVAGSPSFLPKEIVVSRDAACLLALLDREDELTCGSWTYASQGKGYAVSPTIGELFSLSRSSSNTLATDGTLIEASYLAGYLLGQEERGVVKILKRPNSLELKVPRLHAAKKRKVDHARQQTSDTRVLSATESVWSLLDLPFVHTSCNFEEIDMGYAINRVTTKRSKLLPARLHHAPTCCSLAPQQESLWKSISSSGRTVVKQDYYDLRPPCLVKAFTNVTDFWEHCVVTRSRAANRNTEYAVTKSGLRLLDGSQLRFRSPRLESASECLNNSTCEHARYITSRILARDKLFVKLEEPTVIHWKIPPITRKSEFVYYLIRRFGSYEFEFDLAVCGVEEALVATKCMPDRLDNNTVNAFLRRFYDEDLKFWSRGTRAKLDVLLQLRSTFLEMLDNRFENSKSACVPHDMLYEEAEREFEEEWNECALGYDDLQRVVPDLPEHPASDFVVKSYTPPECHERVQSAIDDQNRVLQHVRECLDSRVPVRLLLLGPPGSGKSWLTFAIAAQMYAYGYQGIVPTAISTLRARTLGGRHAHALFKLKVDCKFSLMKEAGLTLDTLNRCPVQKQVLQRAKVLLLDEISTFTAAQLQIIDHVLQEVRNDFTPFGGMHVVANGDPYQLTIDDRMTVWDSLHLTSTFQPVHLTNLIRSLCPHQERILLSLRRQIHSPEECFAIADDILQHVTLLEPDELERSTRPLVLSTQRSLQEAQKRDQKKDPDETFSRTAEDVVRLPSGGTRQPLPSEMKAINKACGLRPVVTLRRGARAKVTVNLHEKGLSNGDFVWVESVALSEQGPHTLMEASVKSASSTIALYPVQERRVVRLASKSIVVVRKQLPIRLDVGDTIHAYQGATLAGTVTLLSAVEEGYALWNKEQLISLLGRTRFIIDTCFASPFGCPLNKDDIRRVLVGCIATAAVVPDRFVYWLQQHDILSTPSTQAAQHQIRPALRVPRTAVNVCYLLFSARRRELAEKDFYVGSAKNLALRVLQHNGVYDGGAQETRTGRPWAPFAMVGGFADYEGAKAFEMMMIKALKTQCNVEPASLIVAAAVRDRGLVFTKF